MIQPRPNFKNIFIRGILGIMLIALLFACNKAEFMPAPEGKQIQYTDSSLTVLEFLRKSPEYSLFLQAWQRSNIQKILSQYEADYAISILLPDNKAMEASGFNSNSIRVTPVIILDSLIRIHTISKQLFPEALALQSGNLSVNTMQDNSDFTDAEYFGSEFYTYRQHLAISDEKLLLNGKIVGLAALCKVLKGATVFPIDHVIKKQRKSIRQLLYEDERFSMYLAMRRHNDSLYNKIAGIEETFLKPTTYDNRYVLQYGGGAHVLNYFSDINYTYGIYEQIFYESREIYSTTLLVPTNEAFQKAGFNNLQDLIALNNRAVPYQPDGWSGVLSGYLPTDSILNNHYWGCNDATVKTNIRGNIQDIKRTPVVPLIFYTNDMENKILWDFKVSLRETGTGGQDFSLVNPLDFIRDGSTIRVRVKGSGAEPATIIEKDIEAFNGVIHVVDRLLVPAGFKLH